MDSFNAALQQLETQILTNYYRTETIQLINLLEASKLKLPHEAIQSCNEFIDFLIESCRNEDMLLSETYQKILEDCLVNIRFDIIQSFDKILHFLRQ